MPTQKAALLLVIVLLGSVIFPAWAQEDDASPTAISVWWPDALYTGGRAEIDRIFDDFNESNALDLRIYQHEIGADLHRLLLTRDVAPDALPDIMLLRREDLEGAVNAGLLQPLDGWVPFSITGGLSSLSPELLNLGEVNGVQYGWPYMLEIRHMLYNTTIFDVPPTDFTLIFSQDDPILFPGRPRAGGFANYLIMAEYLAAGGSLVNDEGLPALDAEITQRVLEFYAEGVAAGLFTTDILDYSTPFSYWGQITSGASNLAMVDSGTYLRRRDALPPEVAPMPLPTLDGTPRLLVDGWLWVVVTDDLVRQERAQRFLNWMMDTDNLADSAQILQLFPAQQRAVDILNEPYLETLSAWLPDSIFATNRNSPAAAALQTAFEAVLEGMSPEEATATAVEGLAS